MRLAARVQEREEAIGEIRYRAERTIRRGRRRMPSSAVSPSPAPPLSFVGFSSRFVVVRAHRPNDDYLRCVLLLRFFASLVRRRPHNMMWRRCGVACRACVCSFCASSGEKDEANISSYSETRAVCGGGVRGETILRGGKRNGDGAV